MELWLIIVVFLVDGLLRYQNSLSVSILFAAIYLFVEV